MASGYRDLIINLALAWEVSFRISNSWRTYRGFCIAWGNCVVLVFCSRLLLYDVGSSLAKKPIAIGLKSWSANLFHFGTFNIIKQLSDFLDSGTKISLLLWIVFAARRGATTIHCPSFSLVDVIWVVAVAFGVVASTFVLISFVWIITSNLRAAGIVSVIYFGDGTVVGVLVGKAMSSPAPEGTFSRRLSSDGRGPSARVTAANDSPSFGFAVSDEIGWLFSSFHLWMTCAMYSFSRHTTRIGIIGFSTLNTSWGAKTDGKLRKSGRFDPSGFLQLGFLTVADEGNNGRAAPEIFAWGTQLLRISRST